MRDKSSGSSWREWDAGAYHRLSEPQFAWGMRVLDRLTLRGDERMLDVGCGSGRLTAELRARLPRGMVVATDLSFNMVAAAGATLAERFKDGWHLVNSAAQELPFRERFDVIFSTATLHWVTDHAALFVSLHEALAPGGRLHAQCGGGPNLAMLHERAGALKENAEFSPHFGAWRDPWEFADEITTSERLRAAGFTEIVTSLEHALTVLPDRTTYREFLGKVVIRPYLTHLPSQALKDRFIDALAGQASRDAMPYSLDYWRLNLAATRPAARIA